MEENKRAAGRLNEIRQRRIRNRRMIVGISFVVFAFCIVMGIQMVQKNSNLKKLKEQESKLAQQYQQELQISENLKDKEQYCLLYTSPSPRDYAASRMPSSA